MLRRTSDAVLSLCLSRALPSLCKGQGQKPLHLDADNQESPQFLNELFLGIFKPQLFQFPTIDSDSISDLEEMTDSVEKFMTKEVDSRKIDQEAKIPEATLKSLAELGLFGQQIPTEYGGLGLNATKFARLAELTALDGAISVTLAAHQDLGLKGLLLAGTPEQKRKYLPRLASGEDLAAFCLTEPGSGSDAQSIRSQAVLSEDGSHFLLSGSKIWISNGGLARVMTVFAKTEAIGPDGKVRDRVTAFIVERDFGGVTSGSPEDKLGIRGSNSCTVNFDNTPVPVENVLGEVGQGFKLSLAILSSGRFSIGASTIGAAKFLLKDATQYALTREQFGKPIGHFPLMKEKLARIAVDIYAMESMTYLTAGLIDVYGESALALESAAVKIFGTEALWRAADECLQVYGGLGYTKDYEQERLLRDARAGLIFGGTNELLRMTIGGSGMKYAGLKQAASLRRLVRPRENVFYNAKRQLEMKDSRGKSVDPQLPTYVHPLMTGLMTELGIRANHFRYVVPELLVIHGRNTVEQQMVLRRTADNVIDLYMCSAVAARCSKSIASEVENVSAEIDLASAAIVSGLSRVHGNNMRLTLGQLTVSDEEDVRIADRLLKVGSYCASHPLKRNW